MRVTLISGKSSLLRKRIAIAISICGIVLEVALIALWWRSFAYRDTLRAPISPYHKIWVSSDTGRLVLEGPWPGGGASHWSISLRRSEPSWPHLERGIIESIKRSILPGLDEEAVPILEIPFGLLVLLSAIPIAAAWIEWRFSLRGFLIAAAVVAILLFFLGRWVRYHLGYS
jgi:hypothetical protein